MLTPKNFKFTPAISRKLRADIGDKKKPVKNFVF